jgi:hypothetical protein
MAEIQLKRLARAMARIKIEGTAPLITHRFSAKAQQDMLDSQKGRTITKEHKNPEALYEAALHRLPGDRYGFPATGFKVAITRGASHFNNRKLTMRGLSSTLFVMGEGTDMLVEITGAEPKMREDRVRIAHGSTDIRIRPEFWPWGAELQIIYLPSQLSVDSVVALVDAGGMGGIGEWRPASKESYSGMYGTFKVVDDQDIQEVLL